MPPHVVAVIQARMGSTRLPGKTLMQAAGRPLLQHLIERLQRATTIDRIVVATTIQPEDDAIEALARRLSVHCYRGSVDDVLGRVAAALVHVKADVHVEIHGDGPLVDWRLVDAAVQAYLAGGADVVTNAARITYPPGLELWVYAAALCARFARELVSPEHRETPVLFLMQHPADFTIRNLEAPRALHAPDVYLEVDESADFDVLKTVIDALYPQNAAFTTEDVLAWLAARPALAASNRSVKRRWQHTH